MSDTFEEMHSKVCPILNPSVRPADQREARREADHDLCVMLLPRLPGRYAGCPAGLNGCGITPCAILSSLTTPSLSVFSSLRHRYLLYRCCSLTHPPPLCASNLACPLDLVTTERPDTKAVVTCVSSYYHTFSGAQKVFRPFGLCPVLLLLGISIVSNMRFLSG